MLGRTVVGWLVLAASARAICPHQETGLLRWSHTSSWPEGKKPIGGDSVEIIDGFLLDESPPPLHGVIIQKTGRLVWCPDVTLNLTIDYLLVFGRLDIGSEDCPYAKNTRIILTGIRGQYTVPEFDEKFIGVPPGGTLELHGVPKLSWTKITRTLPKLTPSSGLLYHHLVHKDKTKSDWKAGLYVYVIDADSGEVIQHEGFYLGGEDDWWRNNDSPKLIEFLDGVLEGHFVMMAVQMSLVRTSAGESMAGIYEAVERLAFGDSHAGQSMIRNVLPKDAYALITRKGHVHVTKEARAAFENQNVQAVTLTHTSWSSGFKLTAVSSIDNTDPQKCFVDFKIITTEGAYPILDVIDDVTSWKPGDRVVVTSTDFDWRQAEEAVIVYCSECNNNQIKLDLEAQFMHWGTMINGVDERAEVALLTRNIVIEGAVEPTCPPSNNNCDKLDFDTFGGHIKIMKGFGNVHIEGVEFFHMGQQTQEGHYPIHFHMAEDVDEKGGYSRPAYVQSCSIHQSFARCITIHGTHGLQVKDTVGHRVMGHCFFLEDGGEKRTLLEGNLGSSTMFGDLIPSDTRALATFWITNPQTRVRNNVAAGSQGTGFWFIFPDAPIGTSAGRGFMTEHEARRTAIAEFNNNVAHSNPNAGLFIDHRLAPDGFIYNNNGYDPRVNPLDKLSNKAKVEIYRLTAFKNRYQNAWLRGGWIVVNQSSFADSAIGLTLARGSDQEQFLVNSIIVGETDNIGEPYKFYDKSKESFIYLPRSYPLDYQLQTPIQGFNFYDGPVHISNVWFNGFIKNENRTAGAIGFLRNNAYASSPVSSTKEIYFGFMDGPSTGNRVYDGDASVPGFTDNDGNKEATFWDIDGSVTGVKNSHVIKSGKFYTTAHCVRKTGWNLSICPHRYGKIAVLKKEKQEEETRTQPVMVRDDIPEVYETMTGQYAADFNVILGGSHSYTLHWSHHVPETIIIYGWGLEKGHHVRVGVCLPRDAEFDLYSYYPKWLPSVSSWTPADSIEELDADDTGKKYFWDRNARLLFLKLQHFQKRMYNTTSDCPQEKCPMVRITLIKGDRREADCRKEAYGQYRRAPLEPVHLPMHAKTTAHTTFPPENFGAGPSRTPITHMTLERLTDEQELEWSRWGPCSKTCGGGYRTRRRACGGESCPGPLVEKKECATRFCPANGGFSHWSEWTMCFKLTGCQGFQRRSRDCIDPMPHDGGMYCEGAIEQVRPCDSC